MRNKILCYSTTLGLLVLFTGCATVVPVYETATVKEGSDAGMGIAYQWGNYDGDSASYEYKFVRMDFLFNYGFTREIGVIGKFYGAIGDGKGLDACIGEYDDMDRYFGMELGIQISPFSEFFDNLPITPGLSVAGAYPFPVFQYMQSNIFIGVKNKKGQEILTLGTRLAFFEPYEIFLTLHPSDDISFAFGFSLFPLWDWSEWEHLNPQDFVIGGGFK